MLIKEIMERVGMTQTGRALAYIKDALTEMALLGETHTNTSSIDLVKDQRFYSIPSECIKLLDIRVKDHNNEDGLLRSIPRSIYKPLIIDEADPTLSVSVSALTIPSGLTYSTFTISNIDSDAASYKALTWTVSTETSWITLSPTSGESKTDIDTITATYDKSDVAGAYTGSISVASNGGDATIPVALTIGAAVINITPITFTFETEEDSKNIYISNSGESTLTWAITSIGANISLDSTSGTATTETDTVEITVNRVGLTAGTWSQSITVNGTVIPIYIKVA
jgi:hypothetical protein